MKVVTREFRALHQAVMFFTRVPLPSLRDWVKADLERASTYFPLVGWLVGGVAALVWWSAYPTFGAQVASGLSLAATLLLTGAFHEDGFADVCDGFGGGTTPDRVLEIMRDSRVGAFGAIGVVMVLGLKWQLVASLPFALGPVLLLAGHAVSRGAAVSLLATASYVRTEEGKAKPLATRLGVGRGVVALALALMPLLLLPGWLPVAVFGPVVARVVLTRWFVHRIGGYTGDCLGAVQQIAELAFYLAALFVLRWLPF